MNIIDTSIKKPVTVIVLVALIVLFGVLSLTRLPYQLTPNVTQPEISITTLWPGATPYEIEREITQKQESEIKSTPSLTAYESTSSDNVAAITLTFKIGTDMNKALLEVSNKLNQVDRYPLNVQKPIISAAGENTSPVIWMGFIVDKGNERDIDSYKTFLDEQIKAKFERIEGVASIFESGGREDEIHITLDKNKVAYYHLTINQVITIIQNENSDVSAGQVDIDRHSYRIRTKAQLNSLEDIENIVLFSDSKKVIYLKDIATVTKSFAKKSKIIYESDKNGLFKSLVYGVRPNSNANIIDMTNAVDTLVQELNQGVLKEQKIHIKWFYDQRHYINGAINLVKNNILIGAILAVLILLLFLRSFSATSVVALAIPISIVATFIILEMMNRSLNTISLAGISFAVGMLLDSAIVVLENIDRHRKMDKDFFQAAHDGTTEVFGALIASALTTIAVFVPVIFLESEVGQLFKDIAIAVTAAISFSLFVSISVIPMLWTQLTRLTSSKKISTNNFKENSDNNTSSFGTIISTKIMSVVAWSLKSVLHQIITVVMLTLLSIVTVFALFPKMEYLPQGNQNLILNILIPPAGLSYNEKKEIGEGIYEKIEPHFHKDITINEIEVPEIRHSFFVASGDFIISGMIAKDETRAAELIPAMRPIVNSFPSVLGISLQRGVFEKGIGEGRSINVDIIGEDIKELAKIGGTLYGKISKELTGSQIRPIPSIELIYPEVQLIPNKEQLVAVGMSSYELGVTADVLLDGRKISEFIPSGKQAIDIVLRTQGINSAEDLYLTQIPTPKAGLTSIAELSSLHYTSDIMKIRHVDSKRTITLQVTPPLSMTLEEAITILQKNVIEPLREKSSNNNSKISLSGQADKLTQTITSMEFNLLFALIIIYLLMSALFSNFIYPLVIMFTVPLATAGGFFGLFITNKFIAPQPLDVLTMIGFIILIGIVVNNAILIVHQALNNIRLHNFEFKAGIIEATQSRLRPIFMSSLTSVFGMLPLVLIPGPGSEFYRGLGSVITSGLAFSTIFTIFLTPALLYFIIKMEKKS